MKELLGSIIEAYGSTVCIVTEQGSRTLRAFLQPITSKSWQNMQRAFENLGEIPKGQYLYIGPVAQENQQALYLVCQGTSYTVCRMQTLYCSDEALYDWGLLVKAGEEDPWNS